MVWDSQTIFFIEYGLSVYCLLTYVLKKHAFSVIYKTHIAFVGDDWTLAFWHFWKETRMMCVYFALKLIWCCLSLCLLYHCNRHRTGKTITLPIALDWLASNFIEVGNSPVVRRCIYFAMCSWPVSFNDSTNISLIELVLSLAKMIFIRARFWSW